MTWWNNMNLCPTWISRPLAALSLRARLTLAFSTTLLLTGLLLGISLWSAQRAEVAITRLHEVEFPVEESVLHIRVQLLEARRYEKEFLLRWRELGLAEARTRYVNLFRANLAEIPPQLAEINTLWPGVPQVAALTGEIGQAVADYQHDFLAVVELNERIGYLDSGLEGNFRVLAHAIEALIPAGAPALRADLLQMRRLEKDYLLRGLGQDAAALYQAETRFQERLVRAALAAPLRAQLAALTREYREQFEQYVRTSDQIGELRRAYLGAAARTETPLEQIYLLADSRASATHDQALISARLNSERMLKAGALALLFGLLVAAMLWRSIMRQFDATVRFSQSMAAGDLSTRIDRQDDSEFGRLAAALNAMAQGLQQSHNELQALNAELEQRIAQRTLHIKAANRGLVESSREMAQLAELSQTMLVCESHSDAHQAIASFFMQMFPHGAGRLYLREGGTDTLQSHVDWGAPHLAAPALAADAGLMSRQGLSLCACDEHPGVACLRPVEPSSHPSALCVPLVSQGEAFGLIYLELPATGGISGSEIDPSDKMLAAVVGKQIALGLENLRLREVLREQAIRDALTGLYNRRYLEDTLAREIERARRKQGKLAAIMLDVDHFKRFNDSYGHEAGDVVLAAIGRLLRENVRASDVACRFGGEEFTVLLPDSDATLAAERAELIRRAAHELRLEYDGKALPGVTLSLGAAEFPLHGASGATLLAAADAALYRAKQGGRDRVEGQVNKELQ